MNGWKNDKNSSPVIIVSVIIIVLLEVLVFVFMNMEKQRKKFRQMSLTDGLTGLFNRIGFNEQVEKYLNK